jgi:hypothetical protein
MNDQSGGSLSHSSERNVFWNEFRSHFQPTVRRKYPLKSFSLSVVGGGRRAVATDGSEITCATERAWRTNIKTNIKRGVLKNRIERSQSLHND